ncbi:hypothetical protein B0H13DRAFT_2357612 [Mycena leptocephala]|nr:hypothetical protein B0H13DRAFT_2357612 [Mycena leptocephala]
MRVRSLPSASTPMPKWSPPHPTAPGLIGQMLKDAPLPPHRISCTRASSSAPSFVIQAVSAGCLPVLLFCTRTRVLYPIRVNCVTVLGPHLQRCVDMSPPLTQRGPPMPSSDAAASSPEYTLSHDAGSPTDWSSYRARHSSVPPRLDPARATQSHGECAFFGGHGVCYPKHPLSAARPRILRVMLRIVWARRRRAIIASPPLNDEPQCLVSPPAPVVIETVACLRSLALPMRVLPFLPPRARLLALSLSPDHISFSGAYLPFISPIASHVSSASMFRRIPPVNFFFVRLSVSIHPFSALATLNHPATQLTTVIHLFSLLSRAGGPY